MLMTRWWNKWWPCDSLTEWTW